MGNRLSHRAKIRESRSDDGISAQHHENHFQSDAISHENVCITTASSNSAIGASEESVNGSSMTVSSGSTTDLSVHEVQHLIREAVNKISIKDSNSVHVGDNINCYGAASFVNSSQSNVKVTNQRHVTLVHDFETGTESTDLLRIVRRNEWYAKQPKDQLDRLELPNIVLIAHTVSNNQRMPDFNIVRNIQDFHMQTRGWFDIGYNFIIAHDGSVFVGRGWLYQGAHSRDYNRGSICIAFIDNFNDQIPSNESLNAAQRLIQMGVDIGKIDKNYRVYGHCQIIFSESPGKNLYDAIQTWDRWSTELQPQI